MPEHEQPHLARHCDRPSLLLYRAGVKCSSRVLWKWREAIALSAPVAGRTTRFLTSYSHPGKSHLVKLCTARSSDRDRGRNLCRLPLCPLAPLKCPSYVHLNGEGEARRGERGFDYNGGGPSFLRPWSMHDGMGPQWPWPPDTHNGPRGSWLIQVKVSAHFASKSSGPCTY